MLSSFTGLNTSKLGVMTSQKYLYTTGHNIANSDTKGFSRQRVTATTMPSISLYGNAGKYYLGTGVDVAAVTRVRDFLVDRQAWKQSAANSYYSNLNSVQSKMETIFKEPSETNFQTSLDKFWTSVQNVASNPGDVGTRTTMRQSAVDLVDMIKSCTKELGSQVEDVNFNIAKTVDRVNQITEQILALNKQIVSMEATGGMANDLRDSRDLLVDELAGFARVSVTEDKTGAYTVNFDGQVIVDGLNRTRLEVYEDKNTQLSKRYGYQTLDVRVATVPPIAMRFTDGSLHGLITARDSSEQGVLSKLDMLNDISKALLCDFNQIHKEGLGLDNSTGLNFFGSSNVQYAKTLTTITNNPITGDPLRQDGGFNPEAYGANGSERNWIHYLKVNEVFFDPINGLDKIAAKTLAGNLEVVLSTQNRVNTVGPTPPLVPPVPPRPPAAKIEFVGQSTMVFKGPTQQNIQIRVDTVVDGIVTEASYTLDGGANWLQADCTDDTGRSVLTLKSTMPFEYNIQVAIDPGTTSNSLAVNDTYDMVINPKTGGSASLQNTQYTIFKSVNQYSFTLKNTGVNNGKVTGLELSFDGGVTPWPATDYTVTPVVPAPAGANLFTIKGKLPDGKDFAFQIEVKDDAGNTVGDLYQFKMPPGDAASDNAVRLSQFLKYGVDDTSVTKDSIYMGDVKYKGALGGNSIDEAYAEGLGNLGVQTQTSYSMWINQTAMLDQILTLRADICDVSLDEEITNMIMYQKSYTSNARMLTTLDEALDKLINGTGRVGL